MLRRTGLVFALLCEAAHAQPRSPVGEALQDTVWNVLEDEIGKRNRALGALLSVAYLAINDPEGLRMMPYQIYGDLMKLMDDPIARALILNARDLYRGGYLRLDVTAGASADLSMPAAATASVDGALELPICRVLHAAASGMLGYDDGDALASYSATVGGCLPLPANTLQVDYTRRDNVRASLLARPVTFDERRTSDVVEGDLRFWRWRGRNHQVDVAPIRVDVDHSYSRTGTAFGAWTSSVAVSPAAWHRRGKGLADADQTFTFMYVHFWDLRDDGSSRFAQAGHISPLVIDGIHVAPDATVGADLGVQVAYGFEGSSPTPVVKRGGLYADVNLKTAVGPLSGELRVSHTVLPLFDAQLVRDDRLAARIQITRPSTTMHAEGFVARNQVLRDMPGSETLLVGGGAADAAWTVMPHVFLIGRIELARSLVAALASEPVRVQDEVRATVGITAQYDVRWPDRR